MSVVGCLDADLQHTIYLEPNGSLVSEFVALNIRSDCSSEERRFEEEQEFLDELRRGVYEEELFPGNAGAMTTTLLRKERPYSVVMSARYRSAEEFFADMFELWFDACDVEARLEYFEDETRLVIEIRTDEEDTEPLRDEVVETDEDGCAVCEEPEDDSAPRIILTQGQFVEATGFEFEGDEAIPLPEERVAVKNGVRTYSLTWTTN